MSIIQKKWITKLLVVLGRVAAAIGGGLLSIASSLVVSNLLLHWAESRFPPNIGNPSSDPHGRGNITAAAVLPLDAFMVFLLAAVGSWLGWLISSRKNRSFDLLVSTAIFLAFSGICLANYVNKDIIFTRDAQAALNIPLAASGSVVAVLMQRSILNSQSLLFSIIGSAILAFCLYGFVAVPLWYSLSYLSWKVGAGELKSLDDAAKGVSAAASIIAVVGLQWKNETLKHLSRFRTVPSSSKPPAT